MVLRLERGLVDAGDGEAKRDFADFGAEVVELVGVGSEEVGVGFVSAGGFDADVGDLFHPSGDLLHFGGAEAAGGNSGRT